MEDVEEEMPRIIQKRDISERYKELVNGVLRDQNVQAFIQANRERLTDGDIRKSYARLYEFVQEKKKFQVNDPAMITPDYEPRLMLNFHYINITYVPTADLIARQRKEKIRNRVRAMDMPKDVRKTDLRDFDPSSQGRAKALAEAVQFLGEYSVTPEESHKGLYLQGPFGIRKSFLLDAMANTLTERGFTTAIVHFPTFTVEMRQVIGRDQVGEKPGTVKKSPILMIDNIDAESVTSWAHDDILSVILQYRVQEQLVTFLSSNLDLKALEEHLTMMQRGEQEPLKARRIMERVRYLSKKITMTGNDRRNG